MGKREEIRARGRCTKGLSKARIAGSGALLNAISFNKLAMETGHRGATGRWVSYKGRVDKGERWVRKKVDKVGRWALPAKDAVISFPEKLQKCPPSGDRLSKDEDTCNTPSHTVTYIGHAHLPSRSAAEDLGIGIK